MKTNTSKIASAFEKGKAFIAFVTGGDPSLKDTERYVLTLAAAGADLIEIGIPFSDPIAEGPVNQAADLRALAAGTRTADILDLVRRLRAQSQVPLVLMTYLNPVFHYGYEAFFAAAADAGVDGIIIADLPFEERGELVSIAAA
ncbi:MAG: tryptophan synthase subunit alpha, partial [Coriobacteriales bacterium]|nr:tryptophan synthase subunit alpha [Coriobacteriales bacterium]